MVCLAGLARAAAAQGQPERAARLFAAVPVPYRARGPVLVEAADRAEFDREVASVRAQLGEAAFAAAWAAGQAMTTEQAVAYALDQTPSA
jgi:hypothetical protein